MRTHRSYLGVIKKLTASSQSAAETSTAETGALDPHTPAPRKLVQGMAHITGGGITENLPRILPRGLDAVIDLTSWEVPPLFTHLQQLGNVEHEEMFRTFNMGIGLIVVVPADHIKKIKAILNRANERFCIMGKVVARGSRKVIYN